MVKGVWNIKNEQIDVSARSYAGGKDTAVNSRDRYKQANFKGTPFGTSEQESTSQWGTCNRTNYGQTGNINDIKTAGTSSKP